MENLIRILKTIKPEIDFESKKCLVDDGVLDSLEIVEIIDMIENEFKITISADQIDPDNFQSIDSMWKMIVNFL